MTQAFKKFIPAQFPTKKCSSFNQFIANPISQFLRGGIGEGYHQDFRGHEGFQKPIVPAVPQHQPQIKGPDGIGFPCSRTGFNETKGADWKGQRIKIIAHESYPFEWYS